MSHFVSAAGIDRLTARATKNKTETLSASSIDNQCASLQQSNQTSGTKDILQFQIVEHLIFEQRSLGFSTNFFVQDGLGVTSTFLDAIVDSKEYKVVKACSFKEERSQHQNM